MKTAVIPRRLQPFLWSVDINKLDLDKNKTYIIHQIFAYGDLPALKWLFKTYGKKDLVSVFLDHPLKIYPRHVFYFVKNYLLDFRNKEIDEDKYITSISGPIRQRTTASI